MTKDKLREYNIGDEDGFATRSTYAIIRSGRGNRRKHSTKMAHIEDFQMYLVATGITDKKKKRALLLYQAGPKVREIFRQIPENGNDDVFDKAIELLNAHFEPQKHRLYDVYEFRQAKQGSTETLDQYYTRLRTLPKRCDFADPDFEIMLQIVLYGTSGRLRKQALRDPKMTLQGLLVTGRQLERSNGQAILRKISRS